MPRTGRQIALIVGVALFVRLLPFAVIGEAPGERWLFAKDDHAGLFDLAGAGLLAVDVLLPIPSSAVGTMRGQCLGFGPGFVATFACMMMVPSAATITRRIMPCSRAVALPAAPSVAAMILSRSCPSDRET